MILLAWLLPTLLFAQNATVLVYEGPGSCKEECASSAADLARGVGLNVLFVGPEEVKPGLFKNAVAWIQPGGVAGRVSASLEPSQLQLIRSFVKKGGGYLGFCAGAFLAGPLIDEEGDSHGLGFLKSDAVYYAPGDKDPYLLPINWLGITRHLYFEQGPSIPVDATEAQGVVARYPDGRAATVQLDFGKGRVAISGVHPEAPESWKQEISVPDPDGQDQDLGQAMLRWVARLP